MKFLSRILITCTLNLIVTWSMNSFGQTSVQFSDLTPQEKSKIQEDVLSTTPVPDGVEIRLTLKDAKGRYVSGMDKAGVFRMSKLAKPDNCTAFTVEEVTEKTTTDTLYIAIVLDYSGTMEYSYKEMQQKAWGFITSLPIAKYSRVVFDHHIKTITIPPTTNPQKPIPSEYHEFGGSTALYGGIMDGIKSLQGVKGPKIVLVFTDGIENASGISANTVIKKAWAENVSIYAIYDPQIQNDYKVLSSICHNTNGEYYSIKDMQGLADAFNFLKSDFQNYYKIKYVCKEKPAELPIELSISDTKPEKAFAINNPPSYGLIAEREGDERRFYSFLFVFDDSRLIPSQNHGEIKKVAHNVADFLMEDGRNHIILVGYSSPEGDSLHNLLLSKKRVDYIYRELDRYILKKYKKRSDKYKAAKLRNRIEIEFHGPEGPINDPKGPFNKENRRVEIYGYKE